MSASYCKTKIIENKPLSDNIYLMVVALGDNEPKPICGQFYMLRNWPQTDAPLLSRPISVHYFDEEKQEIYFLYEKRGNGTQKLAQALAGDEIELTGPSGNGFDVQKLSGKIALVGGGIGTAPLLQLAKDLTRNGAEVTCLLGFRDFAYQIKEFEKHCVQVKIATDKGSFGHKGFVTDLLNPQDFDAVCVCGPEIMMEKTARMCMAKNVPVYVSKEGKMACGVGACLGCTCKTKNGGKSVCKDGPVFEGSEIYD